MTKQEQRLHAAVAAMQGYLSSFLGVDSFPTDKQIAEESVRIADALLAELDRTAPKDNPPIQTYGGWRPCPTCGKPCIVPTTHHVTHRNPSA